jgi:hypothetical protein
MTGGWGFRRLMSLQPIAAQIADIITTETRALDKSRRRLFLEWLAAHTSQLECNWPAVKKGAAAESLKAGLETWLGSLPVAGMLLEYGLMLHELDWCQALDEQSLAHLSPGKTGEVLRCVCAKSGY